MSTPLRIAMWSGPRNISTAMMRAWENRGDCSVTDEPLYAAFLAQTGIDHPGRDEVIATGETDVRKVVGALTGPIPDGNPIWYQKHMAHHLLPTTPRDWIPELTNLLLIRDPAEVVSSYVKSRPNVTPQDLGLVQQTDLYDAIAVETGKPPPVIDAGDFLRAPEAYLRALCRLLDIEFTPRMLRWPPGRRASDGIWAKHWYAAVEASTRFEPSRPREINLDAHASRVVEACQPHYRRLYAVRMIV
jgi:hypothetical protein